MFIGHSHHSSIFGLPQFLTLATPVTRVCGRNGPRV